MRSDIVQELPAHELAKRPICPPRVEVPHETDTAKSAAIGPGVSAGRLLFCLVNSAIATALLGRFLAGQQAYDDLISGSLIWTNADKGFDFRLFYTFLAFAALFWVVLSALAKRLPNTGEMSKTLDRLLILSLTPGALWLGSRLATISLGTIPAECLLCGLATLALTFGLSRRRLDLNPEAIEPIVHIALLTLFLAFFGGLGLATLISRAWGPVEQAGLGTQIVSLLCGATFVAECAVIVIASNESAIRQGFRHITCGSQLLLPLLCAVVIPPVIIVNKQVTIPSPGVSLTIVLLLLMTGGWISLIRKWREEPKQSDANGVTRDLAFFAILPIAIFIAVNHGDLPTFVGDDFHLGEHLLPWQQLRDFGKLPFVDFVPVHPLMDLIVGGVNDLFFDGTLTNYENSRTILFAIGAAATFAAVYRFRGVGLALCLALAGNVWDRLLFVPPTIALLCNRSLFNRRAQWLPVAVGLCFLNCFYNPAAGIALTMAMSPVGIFQVWQLFRSDRKSLFRALSLLGAGFVVISAVPVSRHIIGGFIQFLIDNGRTVVIAHASEWEIKVGHTLAAKGILGVPLLWEALRLTWIGVVVLAGAMFTSAVIGWRKSDSAKLVTSGVVCLFLLFLAKWTLNRIDLFNPSRTGEVSYLACLYLLPLMVVARQKTHPVLVALFVFGVGFFQQGFGGFINSGSHPHRALTFSALTEKAVAPMTLPEDSVLVDGKAVGLPNVGKMYAPLQWVSLRTELHSATAEFLRPGETFFDLTNRQANYYYLGLPVACSYGAPWLAANSALQDQLLQELGSHPPPLIWAGPPLTHDNGTASLRTYKIYRWAVQHYVPFQRGPNIFMGTPERAVNLARPATKQMELLRAAFNNPALEQLPSAWGSSWPRLANRFAQSRRLKVSDNVASGNATLSLGQNEADIRGLSNDFLKFDFASNLAPTDEMNIEISWTSEYGWGSARLSACQGTNLVPLGAFPDWLLSRQITNLQIRPLSPPAYLRYSIRNPQLMRLKD